MALRRSPTDKDCFLVERYSTSSRSLGDSREIPSPPELQDYDDLLVLLSARVACFEFLDSIEVDLPADVTLHSLWTAQSRCIKANHYFARMVGVHDPFLVEGKSFRELIPRNDTYLSLFSRWIENNFFVQRVESRERDSEGVERVLESSINASFEHSRLKKIWFISRDVTDRKRLVESLQEAERHYRTLVERPGQIMARAKPDGTYLYVSPNSFRLFGYTLADFNATPGLFCTLLHPDDVEKHEPILEARRSKDTRTVEVEYRVRVKDGTYHWFFERQMPKLNDSGEIEFYDSIALDIQERKQLEAELRHAQRMELIGTLAGGIAHDFNNHLTAVLGQIALSLQEIGSSHPCFPRLAAAEQGALCCAEITKQLLSFGRKNADPTLRAVDINRILSDIALLLGHVLPSRIQLNLIPNELVRGVLADDAQVQQVLMNLAVNARDAMPRGGTLTIEVRKREIVEKGESRAYSSATPGDYVEILVSDTGVGIPSGNLAKIFEPFFTTKAEGKGTGLGLSMVYSIVNAHGGAVHVTSEVGSGTTFSFILPATDLVPVERALSKVAAVSKGTETILLADDDDMIRSMASTALSLQGYKVIEAVNGDDAVRQYAAHRNAIRLVLVDETMPKRSGREVIMEIVRRDPRMAFILTSGYGKKVLDSGFPSEIRMQFVNKPYLLNDLFALIRTLIDDKGSTPRSE